MNCPKCNATLNELWEERYFGKYKNVVGITVYIDCPQCGYNTDSTKNEGIALLAARKSAAEALAASDGAEGGA